MNEFLRTLLFLPEQASSVAAEIDALHYFVILVTIAGSLFIAAITAYFLVRYRRPGGRERTPADAAWTVPVWLEIVLILGLLGLFVMWWVIGFRQYVRMQRAPKDAMEVYVTGKKWMWSFAYPDGSGTQDVMYVPAGQPVKLVMSSRDVIHSFYVPEFRIKQDVVPGRVTTAWFEAASPGVYQIFCTEYCGTGHSTMRGQVVALSPEDYEQRLAQPARQDLAVRYYEPPRTGIEGDERITLAAVGARVAARQGCLRCHTVDGAPHIGPTWLGVYGATVPLEGGGAVIADEAYLTESMMDPLARIRRGFPPVMPPYQGILTPGEIGALVEYIKTLRDMPAARSPAALPSDPRGTAIIDLPTDYTPDTDVPRSPGILPGKEAQ